MTQAQSEAQALGITGDRVKLKKYSPAGFIGLEPSTFSGGLSP